MDAVAFEMEIKVYDIGGEWLGAIKANDINLATKNPMCWCFYPVPDVAIGEQECAEIFAKLKEMNDEAGA